MEGEARIWYNGDMATAIIPKKEEMLSVKEIGDILAVPLRECGATAAYLGGGYVRADRNGDIRSDDELTLFVVAAELPDGHIDRYEHFRSALRLAEDNRIYLRFIARTQAEMDNVGGVERGLRKTLDDWAAIL